MSWTFSSNLSFPAIARMNEIYLLAAHRCQCVMVSCYFVLFHPLLALMTALE